MCVRASERAAEGVAGHPGGPPPSFAAEQHLGAQIVNCNLSRRCCELSEHTDTHTRILLICRPQLDDEFWPIKKRRCACIYMRVLLSRSLPMYFRKQARVPVYVYAAVHVCMQMRPRRVYTNICPASNTPLKSNLTWTNPWPYNNARLTSICQLPRQPSPRWTHRVNARGRTQKRFVANRRTFGRTQFCVALRRQMGISVSHLQKHELWQRCEKCASRCNARLWSNRIAFGTGLSSWQVCSLDGQRIWRKTSAEINFFF